MGGQQWPCPDQHTETEGNVAMGETKLPGLVHFLQGTNICRETISVVAW